MVLKIWRTEIYFLDTEKQVIGDKKHLRIVYTAKGVFIDKVTGVLCVNFALDCYMF